jgi:hypothetical protein
MPRTYELAKRAASRTSRPWWLYPRNAADVSIRLQQVFGATSRFHERRLQDAAASLWLYEADKYRGGTVPNFVRSAEYCEWWGEDWYKGNARSNLVKLNTDSATAALFSDQPRLQVRSNGAPFELRDLVEDRSLALDATVDSDPAQRVLQDCGRDGWLGGWGSVLPMQGRDRIVYKRLQAHQCWWDPVDAQDGDPWAFCVAEIRDRTDLLAWYDGLDVGRLGLPQNQHRAKLRAIEEIPACGGDWLYGRSAYETPYQWAMQREGTTAESDHVLVLHAWRRSTTSDPERADGRYVMLVGGEKFAGPLLLVDMPYMWTRLPVCWWSPYPAPSGGITGIGFAHILRGHQRALDHSDAEGQNNIDQLGYTKILVDAKSASSNKRVLQEFADPSISVVAVPNLQAPIVVQPQAVHEGHLSWSREMRSRAAEDSGLPGVIQSGQTQRGAGASAVSMVEESDRATDRLSDTYKRWCSMRISVGERTLEVIDDALALDADFRATFTDRHGRRRREPWSKLRQLKDDYEIALEETGVLGASRAGRILRALDLGAKGFLDPELVRDMVESSPDIRAATELDSAPRMLIFEQLAELVKPDGRHDWAMEIDADLDLPLALNLATKVINNARSRDAEPDTVLRLQKYKAAVRAALDEVEAEATARAQAAQLGPGQSVAGLLGPGPTDAALVPDPVSGVLPA